MYLMMLMFRVTLFMTLRPARPRMARIARIVRVECISIQFVCIAVRFVRIPVWDGM